MPTSESETSVGARIISRREIMVTLAGLMIVLLTLILGRVNATVVLITSNNDSLPFPDVEASFARRVPGAGIVGLLFAANPSNACEPLQDLDTNQLELPAFLLIERGDCNFVTKVQHAQDAGYAAVIVYNNEDGRDLVTMSGSGSGIQIHAVFVSKQAGQILQKYVGETSARCYMLPAFENTAWSVMAVSFISLLAVSAVLSTFFFVRRHRLRRIGSRLLSREPAGLSSGEVKALPIIIFNSSDNVTSETCAICLEEYANGEKLRILPCHHEFHVACIDQWLTTRRRFCPICKRDAHCKSIKSPPSERTPLLSSITRHVGSTLTSMITSIPVPTETTPVESPLQSPGQYSGSFTRSAHAFHLHHTSYPDSHEHQGQDEMHIVCSESSSTSLPSPVSSVTCTTAQNSSSSSFGSLNTISSVCSPTLVSRCNPEKNDYPSGHGGDLC